MQTHLPPKVPHFPCGNQPAGQEVGALGTPRAKTAKEKKQKVRADVRQADTFPGARRWLHPGSLKAKNWLNGSPHSGFHTDAPPPCPENQDLGSQGR